LTYEELMRLAIRHILLTYSLIVLLTTVLLIGITAYFTGRYSVEYLAQKNMGRQSEQLQEYTQALLDSAIRPSNALAKRFETPPTREAMEGALLELRYLVHAYPELSYLSLSLEETGDYIHVHRFLDGRQEESLYRHRSDGQTIQRDVLVEKGQRLPPKKRLSRYDPRVRPFYLQAKKADQAIWTPAYMFVSPPDGKPELGVTLATPLKDASGKLGGVLSADFTLASLTKYLKKLPLSPGGSLCIVEEAEPGQVRIIAHTNPALVGESIARDPAMAMATKLLPAEKLYQEQGLTTVHRSQENFLVSGATLRRPGDPAWHIYGLTPRSELMAPVYQSLLIGLGVSLAGVLAAVWISFRVAGQITTPLTQLAQQAESLGRLNFTPEKPTTSSVKEIGLLQEAMGKMQQGLQNRLSNPSAPAPSPVTMGLLMFDTQNASLSHQDIATIMESFLPLLERQGSVFRRGSFEIAATWQGPDQVEAACRAVRQCQQLLQERLEAGRSPLQAVLHHSPNPGGSSTELMALLRRLAPLNAIYGTQILATEPLLRAAPSEAILLARPAEKLRIGSGETLVVEELLGLREESDELLRNLSGLGRSVMTKYLSRDFAAAESQARASLSLRPNDPLMRRHLANVLDLQRATPPDGWDGSRVL
jgi:hypothetical protein